jgi:hypothetical protein
MPTIRRMVAIAASTGSLEILEIRGILDIRGAADLFICDHLANGGNLFLDPGDFVGPGASGGIGVGDSGSVLAFGLGEMVEQDVESVLQSRASHTQKRITAERVRRSDAIKS